MVDDRRGKKIVLDLLGRLNKCGIYSPRFDIKNKVQYNSDRIFIGNGKNDGLRTAVTTHWLHHHDHDLWNAGP